MHVSSISTRAMVASAAFTCVAMLMASGCSGGGGGGQSTEMDAGVDGAPVFHREAGNGSASDGSAGSTGPEAGVTLPFDGTVGIACMSDVDCQAVGGPGTDICSNSPSAFTEPLYPTAVCISRGCDPGTDGYTHFCDGPDNPSSPGVCVNTAQGGLCLPTCLFPNDGTAPVGCQGKDTCVLSGFGTGMISPDGGAADVTTETIGIGYCFGGCTQNADCPTGSVCQTNEGLCVKTLAPPTKTIGTACSSADNATTTTPAACDCFLNAKTNTGYCSQFCTVGSSGTCPAGYICDSNEPTELVDAITDASIPGFAIQNVGLSGTCLAACGSAGAGGDGGACSTGTMCSIGNTAGPDCVP
jgi:hypothetical protein